MSWINTKALQTVSIAIAVAIPSTGEAQSSGPDKTEAWDLDNYYSNEASWQADRRRIDQTLDEIDRERSAGVHDAQQLASLLELVSQARSTAGRMAKVGLLQAIVDTSSQEARRRRDEGSAIEAEVERRVAFIEPLIRSIPADRLARWRSDSDPLVKHERRLERILRLTPFAPSPGSEELLNDLRRAAGSGSAFYEALMETDLGWPRGGADKEDLRPARFNALRRSSDSEVRREAFRLFLGHLANFREPLAVALTRRLEGEIAIARHRKLDDPTDLLLVLQDATAPNTVKVAIGQMEGIQPLVTRATRALAKANGTQAFSLADLNARVETAASGYSLERSKQLLFKAVAPLGRGYSTLLQQRLKTPWLHIADSPDKDSIGGVFWQVGGGLPHGVFIYRDDFVSSRTYSGAAVLMMGYASVPEATTPDRREEDLPVFSNALWYLGQLLHADAASSTAAEGEKIAILSETLSRVLNQLVGNAMVVEFEAQLIAKIKSGEALSGQDISHIYGNLLVKYFGAACVSAAPHFRDAWLANGTLFYGPHHASWYLAMSVALALKNRIEAGDPRAIAAVTDGIGRSRTHFSADILADAGIALDDPATYRSALLQLEILVSQLEAMLDDRVRR